MPSPLETYIAKAREKQLTDEKIKSELLNAGWPQADVDAALSGSNNAGDLIPPPPPPTVIHIGMWTGFLYIIFFISLYVFASSIAGIFNNWVDTLLPDINTLSNGYNYYSSGNDWFMRMYLSALVVSAPIFVYLAITLYQQLARKPLVRNLRSRKILIYITLVVTFLIMLGHITWTVFSFFDGKTSFNAIAHVGVTFLTAGSIFLYFVSEVKNDRKIS